MATATQATTLLRFSQITVDREIHARARLDLTWADALAKKHREVGPLDPVVVFHDGCAYWLASGFARLEGRRRQTQRGSIECVVKQGTREDAILYAAGCNTRDQLPRSDEDKVRAVRNLLELIERCPDMEVKGRPLSIWPNTEIANHCGVSESFVRTVKRWLKEESEEEEFVSNESSTEEGDDQDKAADQAKLREQLERLSRKNARKYAELGLLPEPLVHPTDEQGRRLQQAWAHLRAIPDALGVGLAGDELEQALGQLEQVLTGLLPAGQPA